MVNYKENIDMNQQIVDFQKMDEQTQFEKAFYTILNRIFDFEKNMELEVEGKIYCGSRYFTKILDQFYKKSLFEFYSSYIFEVDFSDNFTNEEKEQVYNTEWHKILENKEFKYYNNNLITKLLEDHVVQNDCLDENNLIACLEYKLKSQNSNSSEIYNFYKFLQNLIEFIDKSKVENKLEYVQILKSMLKMA